MNKLNECAKLQTIIIVDIIDEINFIGIACIRKYLNTSTTIMLMNSIASSRFDYSSSIYDGLPTSATRNITCTIRACTRIILKQKRRDHSNITRTLNDYNILSINNMSKKRIISLIRHVLIYRSHHYILESILLYSPHHKLRSSGKILLDLNSCRLIRTNKRTFSMVAPIL